MMLYLTKRRFYSLIFLSGFLGTIITLAIFLFFENFDSICIPVAFLGGIVGSLLGLLIIGIVLRINRKPSNSISFFKKLGFYQKYQDMTDSDLYTHINNFHKQVFHNDLSFSDPFFDRFITSVDGERVWWEDTEADVLPGNKSYIKFITDLSKISRGAFNPQNIAEKWEDEEGPVHVTYTLDDKNIHINPAFLDDYIDINILREINDQIASSGFRFEQYIPFDQTAFILVLSDQEKTLLENLRGWKFYPL